MPGCFAWSCPKNFSAQSDLMLFCASENKRLVLEQCLCPVGTFFHLLEDTAHPCLSLSKDGFSMFYGDEELPLSAMAFDDNTFAG